MQDNRWEIENSPEPGRRWEISSGQEGGQDQSRWRDEKAMPFNEQLSRLTQSAEKQLFYERARTVISVVTALAIILCLVLVVPAILEAVSNVNSIIDQASGTVELAEEAISGITEMSGSITDMGQNMDAFITENGETVAGLMEQIEAVDFEGLNKAIQDLGDVVEPLARFFNRFN